VKFLADENFPMDSFRLLQASGYDVLAISEASPSIEDDLVLAQAVREERIILTFDRDYGELIYLIGQPAPVGIIYFRFNLQFPLEPAELLLQLLEEGTTIIGQFTVLLRSRFRQRPLP
jgi:predicted nuclease of predicted toxin-antitoxin system